MNSTKADIIEVSQFESPEDANDDLQRKLHQLIADAGEAQAVAALREKRTQAAKRVQLLKTSHLHLSQRAKDAFSKVREAEETIDDILIEQRNGEFDRATKEFFRRDADYRAVSRATVQIVERRLPLAEIVHLECEAEEYFALAHELSRIAQERIRRTADLMAQAAEHEGEIAFDNKKTISGHLLTHAKECERRAQECWRWADERRTAHSKLMKEIYPAA